MSSYELIHRTESLSHSRLVGPIHLRFVPYLSLLCRTSGHDGLSPRLTDCVSPLGPSVVCEKARSAW